MTLRPTRAASSVRLADPLPSFEKTFLAVDLMAYGAATWDWARVHYDRGHALELGFKDCFVDGQNFGALFARQVLEWSGPNGFICAMKLRYRAMAFVNDAVTFTAEVAGVEIADRALVTIAQTAARNGAPVATCVTTLRLPR
jgi:acyl dehydratase